MAISELHAMKSQAGVLLEVGRAQDALRLLMRALSISPDDEAALCLMSQGLIEMERWRDAWRYTERAIAVAPENDWAHRLHSIVLAKLRA